MLELGFENELECNYAFMMQGMPIITEYGEIIYNSTAFYTKKLGSGTAVITWENDWKTER